MKYMKLLETAPPLKAESLADGYRVLAEFNGTVLAGKKTLLGAQFVTWAWDYDRRGVSNGHYYMEDYQTAKEDFTFRSGLMAREQVFDRERLEELRQAAQGFLCGEGPASYRQEFRCQRILDQIRSPVTRTEAKSTTKRGTKHRTVYVKAAPTKAPPFTMPGIYLPPVPTSCTPRIIRRTLRLCRCAPAQTCAGAAPTQPMASSAGAPPGNACGLG